MFFDPMYFVFLVPGMLLAAWAQWRVQSTFHAASQMPSPNRLSGADAARVVMQEGGVEGVGIEPVAGMLSDHYDPSAKVLRLSEGVYSERSLAALGVAAHEAGHAIQDAHRYSPLVARNFLVPMASFGSNFSWIVMMAGFFLQIANLIYLGIGLFGLTVLFQVVNLPVEFDASRRARQSLMMAGLVNADDDREIGRVLNAAALTYVAATLTSVLTLLYFLYRAGLLGGNSRSSDE
jgi:Zn-dependent membrane protease YugP